MSERQEAWGTVLTILEGGLGSDTYVVEPHGEVDIGTAAEVEEALSRAHTGSSHRLIVDLTDVGFIDSIGVQVLVAAQRRMTAGGGMLVTVCPDQNVLKVFALMGLVDALNIVRTRRDALLLADRFAPAA